MFVKLHIFTHVSYKNVCLMFYNNLWSDSDAVLDLDLYIVCFLEFMVLVIVTV